jgi:hypothetical protein
LLYSNTLVSYQYSPELRKLQLAVNDRFKNTMTAVDSMQDQFLFDLAPYFYAVKLFREESYRDADDIASNVTTSTNKLISNLAILLKARIAFWTVINVENSDRAKAVTVLRELSKGCDIANFKSDIDNYIDQLTEL